MYVPFFIASYTHGEKKLFKNISKQDLKKWLSC